MYHERTERFDKGEFPCRHYILDNSGLEVFSFMIGENLSYI